MNYLLKNVIFYRLIQDILQLMNREKQYQRIVSMIQMLKERKEIYIHLKLELLMKVNGLEVSEMVMEFSNGQMELDMKDNGEITEPMEKENSLILMVIFMREIGLMIRQMVMEYIIILMAQCMKDIGETIFSMDMVKKAGLMALFMKVNIWLVKNMELVFIVGMMAQNIKENGLKIKSKVSELIAG